LNLSNQIRSGAAILAAHLGGRTPLAVSLSVLDSCNSKCLYCAIPQRQGKALPLEDLLRVLDQMVDMGLQRLVFTGGEPLLRSDIGTLVSHASRRGVYTSLNSNGLLVAERLPDLADLDLLKMSLDGPEEVHDAIRGCPGSFRRVVEALDLARRAGRQVWINAVVTRRNLGHLKWLADFARDQGVFCEFNHLSPHRLAGDLEALRPTPAEFGLAVDFLMRERRSNPYILDSSAYYGFLRQALVEPPGEQVPKRRLRCWSGWLFCYVDTNGDVYPCFDLRGSVPARNAVREGFRAAFRALPRMECARCFCSAAIELNLLAGFKPASLLNVVKYVGSGAP